MIRNLPARNAWPVQALLATGMAVCSAAFGAGLVAVSSRFGSNGPIVLLGLALLPLLAIGVVRDPRWGPLAVFATFPLGQIGAEVLPLGLQIVELALVAVAVILGLRNLGLGDPPLPWVAPLWWVLSLILWMLISLFAAPDQQLAIKQIAHTAGGLLTIVVIVSACRWFGDLRVILGGAVAVASAVAALSVRTTGSLRAELGGARVQGRLEGIFTSPNQFGAFCVLFMFVAVGLALGSRERRSRRAAVVATALLLVGLLLSLSRGAWIGAAIGIAYVALVLPRARRAALGFGLPLALGAAIFSSALPNQPQVAVLQERLGSLTVRSPYDARSEVWAEAVREIRAEPVTGQGPGSFPIASIRSASESSAVFAVHAHNILLNWAAESGIPAAVLLIGFAVALAVLTRAAAKEALEAGDRRRRAVIAGLVAALLSVLGQGMVDYPWGNTVVFVSISTVVGALLAARYLPQVDEADGSES